MPRWTRFRQLFGPDPQGDVDDELDFHLAMRTDELVARGESRERAAELARQRFGEFERTRSTCVGISRRREKTMARSEWIREFCTRRRVCGAHAPAQPGVCRRCRADARHRHWRDQRRVQRRPRGAARQPAISRRRPPLSSAHGVSGRHGVLGVCAGLHEPEGADAGFRANRGLRARSPHAHRPGRPARGSWRAGEPGPRRHARPRDRCRAAVCRR